MVRETPLHLGHLRTMVQLAEMGAVDRPAAAGLLRPAADREAMVDQSVGRALDLFGIDTGTVKRWQGGSGETV